MGWQEEELERRNEQKRAKEKHEKRVEFLGNKLMEFWNEIEKANSMLHKDIRLISIETSQGKRFDGKNFELVIKNFDDEDNIRMPRIQSGFPGGSRIIYDTEDGYVAYFHFTVKTQKNHVKHPITYKDIDTILKNLCTGNPFYRGFVNESKTADTNKKKGGFFSKFFD